VSSVAFTVLSLCSGVGGLELGIKLAVPGATTLGYVEREAFAASVLLARMEEKALEPAPVFCGDLADCDFTPFTGQVDCISTGVPCQPWSVAGKRKGTKDERWLWDDIVETIRTVRPRYIFLENVAGIVTGGGLPAVLRSLAEMRFDAEWMCLRGSDVGASHRRERFFLLAHSQDPDWGTGDTQQQGQEGRGQLDGSIAGVADAMFGSAQRRGRPGAVAGEEGTPRIQERERHESGDAVDHREQAMADAGSQRLQGGELQAPLRDGEGPGSHGPAAEFRLPLFAPGPNDPRWGAILELDPTLEPAICRDADGMASRLDRLRACGNGVVALQSATAITVLARRLTVQLAPLTVWGRPVAEFHREMLEIYEKNLLGEK